MKEILLSVGHLKPSKKFPHGAISNGSIRGKLQSIKTRRYNNTLFKRSSVDGSFAHVMTNIFLVYQ